MNALKRISAIVISLAMIMSCAFSSVVFAASDFNDVADDNAYYGAIQDLVEKGIINGYDNGDGSFSFKPEGTITRAEFAKMIAVADAPGGFVFGATKSSFTDLSDEHWATPYIEYAVNRKIINGMGDGTFAPEAPVTYAQAIKMIICALNYGFAAEETVPWYQTYINLANRLNLNKNAVGMPDEPAVRGLIAQLVYNMNNTAPAVQTGTDETGNPIYSAGTATKEEDSKGTKTYDGVLYGVFNKTVTGNGEGLNNKSALVVNGTERMTFNIGTYTVDDIASFLGYGVTITYSQDSSGANVIERISDSGRNSVYVINDIDISSIANNRVEFYDENGRNGLNAISLSGTIYVLKNGSKINMTQLNQELNVDSGYVTYIDNDSDGAMDVAFIKSYITMYVGSFSNNKGIYTVYDKFDTSKKQEFDDYDEDLVVKVARNGTDTLSDGSFSNLAQSNILSYALDSAGKPTEVIISQKTASGSTATSEVSSVDATRYMVTIGNKTFDYSEYYIQNMGSTLYPQQLAAGDTCNIYLDHTGKIAAVNMKEVSSVYGYVINVGATNSSGSSMNDGNYSVTLCDASGSIKKYAVAQTGFKIDGNPSNGADLEAQIKAAATSVNRGKAAEYVTKADEAVLVRYTLNKNEIKNIYIVDGGTLSSKFVLGRDGAQKLKYSTTTNKFSDSTGAKFTISTGTKVFVVPSDRTQEDDYSVKTGSSFFQDGYEYVIDAYDADTNGYVKAVVVYGYDTIINASADSVIVHSVNPAWDEATQNSVLELSYYVFGGTELKKAKAKKDDILADLNPGDVIKISISGSKIEKKQYLFSAKDFALAPSGFDDGKGGTGSINSNGEFSFKTGSNEYHAMYGVVMVKPDVANNIQSIQVAKMIPGAAGDPVTLGEAVTFNTSNSMTIAKCDPDATKVDDMYIPSNVNEIIDYTTDRAKASKVLVIRHSNSTIKGLIIYDDPAQLPVPAAPSQPVDPAQP